MQLTEQKIHTTLTQGKGELTVEFKVPATVTDGVIRFAAFVGDDYASNIQHYKTDPLKVK